MADIDKIILPNGTECNLGAPTIKELTFTGDLNDWGPFTKKADNKVELKNLNDTIDSNNIVGIHLLITCQYNNKYIHAFIADSEDIKVKVFDAMENLFRKDKIYLASDFGVYSGAICDGTHYEFAIKGKVNSLMNNGSITIEAILSDFSTPGTFSPVITYITATVDYFE